MPERLLIRDRGDDDGLPECTAAGTSRSSYRPCLAFPPVGSSVGTTIVGAIVGASAAVAVTSEMARSIQDAVVVQVFAGVMMLVAAWLTADPPLGTARHAEDGNVPAKGQVWNPVAADR